MKNVLIIAIALLLVQCTTNKPQQTSLSYAGRKLDVTLPPGTDSLNIEGAKSIADKSYKGYFFFDFQTASSAISPLPWVTSYFMLNTGELMVLEGPFDHTDSYRAETVDGEKIYGTQEEYIRWMSSPQFDKNKVMEKTVRLINDVEFYWVERQINEDTTSHYIRFMTPVTAKYMTNGIMGAYYFKNTDREASLQRLEGILGSIYKEAK